MVATQVNSGDSGAGDHDYYFIKSLLEFKGTSTEHSGEGLSKKLGHSPMAWPWPSLVEIVQGVLGRSRHYAHKPKRVLCVHDNNLLGQLYSTWLSSAEL